MHLSPLTNLSNQYTPSQQQSRSARELQQASNASTVYNQGEHTANTEVGRRKKHIACRGADGSSFTTKERGKDQEEKEKEDPDSEILVDTMVSRQDFC